MFLSVCTVTGNSRMSSPMNCPNSFGLISPSPLNRVTSLELPRRLISASRSRSL